MIRARLDITIELTGPFITQGSAPGPWGLDAVLARDANDRYLLPGTHVTGKLREALEELADALNKESAESDQVPDAIEIVCLLGGEAYGNELTARPKRLLFSDFILTDPVKTDEGVRYRVRIDPKRGAVQDRMQLMVESPFASGQPMQFEGGVDFFANDEAEIDRIQRQVETGLQWITQLGAYRGQGFGRVTGVQVEVGASISPSESAPLGVSDSFDLIIHPQSPLCVDDDAPVDNLFRSSEIIPGNVLLGCLFQMLGGEAGRDTEDEYTLLRQHFSRLRLRHAFPSDQCMTRPVAMPLSIVQTGKGWCDVALERGPCLIGGAAPKFQPDWKEAGPRADFGWPEVKRELRVRTAIDSNTLRARDQQLFSYDMVRPDGLCWLSRVDLTDVPEKDRAEVAEQLQRLLSLGLMGLGKTKAIAEVNLQPGGAIHPVMTGDGIVPGLGEDGLICITLQTDALLLPKGILEETSGGPELIEAYRTVWKELCDGLRLERFHAKQALKGGGFLAARHGFTGENYYPWILTRAGSVFVFSVVDQEAAQPAIQGWLEQGLLLAKSIQDSWGIKGEAHEHWRYCPYVPQNGYGEIAVNLPVHERWRPRPEECEAIKPIEEVRS